MGFYDLSKENRIKLVQEINQNISNDFFKNESTFILDYFSDEDTYVRKSAYQAVGKIYYAKQNLRPTIISTLKTLLSSEINNVRQTSINAAGEIGIFDFQIVKGFFDEALFDHHHSVRNAVIGSVKKMSEKNPKPVLNWAKNYLHHPDKEIRREICHGIELRGRTHPQDILPLLKELQNDQTKRVRSTLIHVLGQIAYKKGCLEIVINELNNWENTQLVKEAIDEIIDVHRRYEKFAFKSQEQAINYINENLKIDVNKV